MFKKAKDALLSSGARKFMDTQIEEYGKVLKFNLDSKEKSIELEVMLEGEKEPLHVKINRYELQQVDGKDYITIQDVHTSRAWINTVVSQYLEGKKFEIPAQYASLLKMMI